MTRHAFLAVPLALLLTTGAFAQAQTDSLSPTIPATQIKPSELAGPYEFLSVSTSADDFIMKLGALAQQNAGSGEVKTLAAELADQHKMMMDEARAAGKLDKVEIAAPAVDGEQKGLLAKLEPVKGADFDRAFVEAQIFVHQRAIAYYAGYQDEGNNLAAFAAKGLPVLAGQYDRLQALAKQMGIGGVEQVPAAQ